MRLSVLAILAAAFVAACSHTPRPAPAAEDDGQIVLLIGLDGLRYDAIDRWDAPNLRALAERGTRPERMISVMPTKTFVNFYSIATGLYPEHHGMISNSPWDRAARRHFSTREGSPQDPFWWQGEPIWITAERQGLRSHIMFWLGSESPVGGDMASVWHPYDHEKPYDERVAEVLSWFDAPAAEQPRFAAVYFDHVDTVTHRTGPFTPEEGEAVAEVDRLVGELVAGLESRGLLERTNIIVVSDHGMSPVSTERVVRIDRLADLDGLIFEEGMGPYGMGLEPFLMGYGSDTNVERVYRALRDADAPVTPLSPAGLSRALAFRPRGSWTRHLHPRRSGLADHHVQYRPVQPLSRLAARHARLRKPGGQHGRNLHRGGAGLPGRRPPGRLRERQRLRHHRLRPRYRTGADRW